jgi:hypothetical protein
MKNFITLCILVASASAMADIVRSPIHSVEEVNGTHLIKFANGRVAFSDSPSDLIKGDVVEAKLDKKQNLLAIQTLSSRPAIKSVENFLETVEPPVYEPTVIGSYAEAVTIFNRLNPNYKRASECSNRAHVWASEEFKKNGIKSQKAFLFFTATYITRTRSKWWFHVAPALVVKENGKLQTRVLDYMFNRAPLTVKEWKDQFVFTKRDCLPLVSFTAYDQNADQTQDCYEKITTMYDWMPTDFKIQETTGQYKTQFSQSEINAAYSEAF